MIPPFRGLRSGSPGLRYRAQLGISAVVGLLGLLGTIAVPGAMAGEYSFTQCGSLGRTLDGQYTGLGKVERVAVVSGCRSGGQGKLGVYQDRKGGQFSEAEGGLFAWRAPAGLSVSGLTVRARLKDGNGLRASIAGRSSGDDVDLDDGLAHDGSVVEARWSSRTRAIDSFTVRLRCNRASGCPNRSDSAKAFFEVLAVEVMVGDSRPPGLGGSGGLAGTTPAGRWLSGTVEHTIVASDVGSGLSSLALKVNGFPVPVARPGCAGLSGGRALGFLPCPSSTSRTVRLDTRAAPFQEGANRIEVCASDFAASGSQPNMTCATPATVMVDNRQPPPPVDFRTDTDGAWSATPEVGLRWDSTGDAGSGVASVRWKLVRAGGGSLVSSGSVPGSTRSTTIRVPEAGDYLLETRFVDRAGNAGSPAVARVRFDDIPPPPARPLPPNEWLSRDELPLPALVEPVEAGGPSGIAGYAFATSQQGQVAPCRAVICEREEIDLLDRPDVEPPIVSGLEEGANWLSTVAVSGAMVPSRTPVVTRVLVDRTYPETTLDGIPSGWSRTPVSLLARSVDGLSGMDEDPDDDGRPVTVIEVEGQETVEADGARAEVQVTREGITEVRFHARDLAGNANDGRIGPDGQRHPPPGIERVMVDRTPPSVTYAGRPDRTRPEAVRFEVGDRLSGVEGGRVSIYPTEEPGRKSVLASSHSDGSLRAEVPSDDLPSGAYYLVARVTDRAGNVRASEPVRLTLPLKTPVSLRLSDRASAGRELSGSVRLGGRSPGRPLDLVVEENFSLSSGWDARTAEVRSGPDGSFTVPVRPGPRRTIRVRFAGTATVARATSRPVQIVDRDQVSFSTSTRVVRNGRVLTMRGRVTGPGFGPAQAGKGVVVQFYDPSRKRWRPVEVVSCGAGGRFRLDYRFTTITSPQRIRFRAQSLGDAGWPFRPSVSRSIEVVVRP